MLDKVYISVSQSPEFVDLPTGIWNTHETFSFTNFSINKMSTVERSHWKQELEMKLKQKNKQVIFVFE